MLIPKKYEYIPELFSAISREREISVTNMKHKRAIYFN